MPLQAPVVRRPPEHPSGASRGTCRGEPLSSAGRAGVSRMNRWIALALVAVLVAVIAVIAFSGRERPYDPAFDTTVADPAYRADGPVVLFDEAHRNTHT